MPLRKTIVNTQTGEVITVDMSPDEERALLASKQDAIAQSILDDQRDATERAKPTLEKRIEALEKALLAILRKG